MARADTVSAPAIGAHPAQKSAGGANSTDGGVHIGGYIDIAGYLRGGCSQVARGRRRDRGRGGADRRAATLSKPASAAGSEGTDAGAPGGGSPGGPTSSVQRRSIAAPRFGFADDLEQQLLAIDASQDLRANIGRVPIPWYFRDWSLLDQLYDGLYSSGIRPIITLAVTQPPAAGPTLPAPPALPIPPLQGPQPTNLPPAPPVPDVNTFKPGEFAALAAYIAQRYPWAKIQLLNEPNLPFFRSFSIAQTVETVTTAARAVHEVDPNARLIGPAASPDQGRGFAYTRAVYSQLPPDLDYVDAATNIYPGPGKTRAFRQVKKSWRTAHRTGPKGLGDRDHPRDLFSAAAALQPDQGGVRVSEGQGREGHPLLPTAAARRGPERPGAALGGESGRLPNRPRTAAC